MFRVLSTPAHRGPASATAPLRPSAFSFLIAAALALGWSQSAAAQSLRGTVTDADTRETLPGAHVVLEGTRRAAYTDAEGVFQLAAVPPGTYPLTVSYVGYAPLRTTVRVPTDTALVLTLRREPRALDEVIVRATRATTGTGMAYTNVDKAQLEQLNLGQDFPFLLNFTPSLVTTSDAGAGVGYTGLRIRGSDPTRVNVTINGVPINDAESQGVFYVNMPDLASSVDNVQVQRGVGTSTNGGGAFGASVNIQTETPGAEPTAEVTSGYGSFNTWRHTFKASTGRINDRFAADVRLSRIRSDGFMDRAFSDLRSFFASGQYFGKNSSLKAIVFSGQEQTYQAWYGVPEAVALGDRAGIEQFIGRNFPSPANAEYLRTGGRTFNWAGTDNFQRDVPYDNEIDNYQQDHYQLFYSRSLSQFVDFSVGLHYTKGRGYFEQFRVEDRLATYGRPPLVLGADTFATTDLIRRRWLDNDFYGTVYSAHYGRGRLQLTAGGAWHRYVGDHFGEVIWARLAGESQVRDRYYQNVARKTDFNQYVKALYQLADRLETFGDVQYRYVDYRLNGFDNLPDLVTGDRYHFFNPKVGFNYQLNARHSTYASVAVANKEPNRNDFEASPDERPGAETLYNGEAGYRWQTASWTLTANAYYMYYRDQLVLTGQVNDVGAYVRRNIADSYRAGLELIGGWQPTDWLRWEANATLSRNRIGSFTEFVDNFDAGGQEQFAFRDTPIAFSPDVIAGSQLTLRPGKGFEVGIFQKYVGPQFLDNTGRADRRLAGYFTTDVRLAYRVATLPGVRELGLSLLINNVFDVRYASNGYTFGYVASGARITENYLYPQAGINFLTALTLRF